MATNLPPTPPQYPPPPPPGPRKTSPIVWILGIIAAIVAFALLVVFVVGLFIAHKVKQMAANPGLAVAKMIAAANPDVEVVSIDNAAGTITLRDKKTGEKITMNYDDVKKGKLSFDSDGKHATITADGKGLQMTSSDGSSVRLGSGGKIPDWIPIYPGTQPKVGFSAETPKGTSGQFQFETSDTPDQVVSFYSDKLKSAGLKITGNIAGQVENSSGNMLTAEDADKHRTVLLTVGKTDGKNTVNVVFNSK